MIEILLGKDLFFIQIIIEESAYIIYSDLYQIKGKAIFTVVSD